MHEFVLSARTRLENYSCASIVNSFLAHFIHTQQQKKMTTKFAVVERKNLMHFQKQPIDLASHSMRFKAVVLALHTLWEG